MCVCVCVCVYVACVCVCVCVCVCMCVTVRIFKIGVTFVKRELTFVQYKDLLKNSKNDLVLIILSKTDVGNSLGSRTYTHTQSHLYTQIHTPVPTHTYPLQIYIYIFIYIYIYIYIACLLAWRFWHINMSRLFNAQFCIYTCTLYRKHF